MITTMAWSTLRINKDLFVVKSARIIRARARESDISFSMADGTNTNLLAHALSKFDFFTEDKWFRMRQVIRAIVATTEASRKHHRGFTEYLWSSTVENSPFRWGSFLGWPWESRSKVPRGKRGTRVDYHQPGPGTREKWALYGLLILLDKVVLLDYSTNMSDPTEVPVVVKIPKDLDRRVEIAAATEGVTKKQFYRQALEARIVARPEEAAR